MLAAGPRDVVGLGQPEVVAEHGEAVLAGPLGVRVGGVESVRGPVGAPEDPDPALPDLGVEHVDELLDRDVGVVPVHQVEIGVVGAQPVQRLGQLTADRRGVAVRCVRALDQDRHLVPDPAVGDPATEQPLLQPAPVDVPGVEGVAAGGEEVVEHRRRVGQGLLVVAAHHQA